MLKLIAIYRSEHYKPVEKILSIARISVLYFMENVLHTGFVLLEVFYKGTKSFFETTNCSLTSCTQLLCLRFTYIMCLTHVHIVAERDRTNVNIIHDGPLKIH